MCMELFLHFFYLSSAELKSNHAVMQSDSYEIHHAIL